MAEDLVLDLSNYRDTVGSYVNPGRYPVVVEDAEMGESSKKKTKQLTLWLRVVGGEFDGSTLVEPLYLTDASMFRVVGFLQAVNLPTPKRRITVPIGQIIGRRVSVIVEDDEYNGRTRSRVTSFERVAAAAQTGADPLDELEEGEADLPAEEGDDLVVGDAAEAEAVEVAPEPEAEPEPAKKPAATKPAPAPAAEVEEEGMDLDDLEL